MLAFGNKLASDRSFQASLKNYRVLEKVLLFARNVRFVTDDVNYGRWQLGHASN